ncbi:MAG: alanine racemase [Pirellulaceae bacterium]
MEQAAGLKNLQVQGLMGMASLTGGNETARRNFIALRQLRDQLAADCPDGVLLNELSMGMSGDYEVAIEEGATMVRIGSALFDGVDC